MTDTPNLKLTMLAAGQSQKHVTMNDALVTLDSLAQLSVINRTLTSPPASPAEGDAYIVAEGPTGAFAGHANHIAVADSGEWRFHLPRDGWRCCVVAEQLLLVWLGGQWINAAMPNSPTMLGLNTGADTTNRFALKSTASLFDHAGAGHQIKLNKALSTNTASLLFQTAYSGRAEMGLMGDDKWRCKVSVDGTSWRDALTIDQATGLVTTFGAPTATLGIATKGYVDGQAANFGAAFDYQTSANQSITTLNVWTQINNMTTGRIASANFNTALNRFTAPATGIYLFMVQLVQTAGPAAATVTAAVLKNGTAAGIWVSRVIPANAQDYLTFQTMISLTAGETAGLGVYATSAVTVVAGHTYLSGYRI